MPIQYTPMLSRRALLGAAAGLILVFLGIAAAVGLVLRNEAIESAEENLANMAAVLAEQRRHLVQAVDLVVSATVQDFSGSIPDPASRPAALAHERLRERAAALPELVGIAVIDREGVLRNHSRRFPPPPEKYDDREYFPVHRDRREPGLHVGRPVIGRLVQVPQQIYSRRIEDAGGNFIGIVSAGVRADHADAFYRALRLGPGGRIAIFRSDGVMIDSYPLAQGAVGRSYAGDPLFTGALAARPSGVLHRAGLIDGDARIVAYETVRDYPLVVMASSTDRYVLAEWRDTAIKLAVSAAAVSALIGLMAFLTLRQMQVSAGLQDELRDTGERMSGIIHSAMDAIITVDDDQKIVLFNTAAERIFRCPAAEAAGSRLERFIPERYRAAHRGHVERFGATGTTSRQMGARMVLAGLRADGEEFPIDASISQVTAGGRKLYTVILRDITERKRNEDALQQAYYEVRNSGERLRGIIQSAMDAIITVDQDQKVVLFNEAAEKIFQCRAEQAIGGALDRFIPERFRGEHKSHIERFGETRVTTRMMGPRRALVGLRVGGQEFPIDAAISQVTVEGRKLYTVILRDVTEQRAAEEAVKRSFDELRELSAAMNDVREAERTRIARELHDELAQWLTALKMDVSWLSGRLPADNAALLQRTDKMRQLVDTTVMAVRRIAADLRPVMLDDLGLVPSIEHVAHTFSERTSVPVTLDIHDIGMELRDPLATAVYRMVQEALTNVARHARATDVVVSVRVRDETLHVLVRDNGVGLPAAPPVTRSHGMLGIRERAQTLGGSVRIHSPPEGGTLVEIAIPLARYRKPEAA